MKSLTTVPTISNNCINFPEEVLLPWNSTSTSVMAEAVLTPDLLNIPGGPNSLSTFVNQTFVCPGHGGRFVEVCKAPVAFIRTGTPVRHWTRTNPLVAVTMNMALACGARLVARDTMEAAGSGFAELKAWPRSRRAPRPGAIAWTGQEVMGEEVRGQNDVDVQVHACRVGSFLREMFEENIWT